MELLSRKLVHYYLFPKGFLTDDLTVHDDKGDGSGSKYLGVCRLDGPDRKV